MADNVVFRTAQPEAKVETKAEVKEVKR